MDPFDPVESFANLRHEFGEHGGVNMSVEASTTFTVIEPSTMPEIFQGRLGPEAGGCYLYGRHFNPTVYVLGRQIGALEGAETGYCAASGLAAISSAIMQVCDSGDHVVSGRTVYGGTFALLSEFLPQKTGVQTTFVDLSDLEEVEQAFVARTKVLFCETISNPTLRVADLPALAEIAHRHGAMLVVDNTFAPLIVSPILHGADVVVHSVTKFMNGASDHIAGAICGKTEFVMQLMDLHTGALMLLGPTMDPQVAFEISLRLPHLGLRMVEHSRRALAFAERLHALGLPVNYPGLPSHIDHALMRRMANAEFGYGGILTLDLGTREKAFEFMRLLQNVHRFGLMAVSLGFSETLMSCSAASTSSEMPDEELERAGVKPGLVRLSIGYTGSLEQRWSQLHCALQTLGLVGSRRLD
ncbi:MAG: aminotransferase class I/II-fold pyridoxal phosphate-dependent enzyme [Fimbriimonadaceae bacterium]|nr:aminotransferase class I/II-fold pyridoxal phosphate-dependent enzyme [Chthonomonadaceae bacterium]MCO5295226.1 aminotransferase class I/II-fold pyridoxal phosphate-dependent enzyme [Fimbriimonadaceae bacterium]